jgi:hypothetical protein
MRTRRSRRFGRCQRDIVGMGLAPIHGAPLNGDGACAILGLVRKHKSVAFAYPDFTLPTEVASQRQARMGGGSAGLSTLGAVGPFSSP